MRLKYDVRFTNKKMSVLWKTDDGQKQSFFIS